MADSQSGKKTAKPDGDKINLPGFHNYAYSLVFRQLLSSLAISLIRRTTRGALAESLVFYDM
ncbi:hypothetical protein TUM17569_22220 [Klebsiella oxytoca]|nr:hypothetical protein TUM17568_14810 [Klebsiella oxytoca]GJK96761.1 hypothetical protein TUM17569_22220 [Klebsiella oxytoca]